METLLWVLQIALAVLFGVVGLLKLTRSRSELAPRMEWVEDATDRDVKVVGGLEVLAAIGLILPAALGILSQLTALAACGVVLLMLGAIKTHASRNEFGSIPMNVAIAAMGLLIAVQRFGPQSL